MPWINVSERKPVIGAIVQVKGGYGATSPLPIYAKWDGSVWRKTDGSAMPSPPQKWLE